MIDDADERHKFITAQDQFSMQMQDLARHLGDDHCSFLAEEIDRQVKHARHPALKQIFAFAAYGLTQALAGIAEAGEDIK